MSGEGSEPRKLASLRSRCSTLRLCASCIARASVSTSFAASRAGSGLPQDDEHPLANTSDLEELILWRAYKEAKDLIKFEAAPSAEKK